MERVALMTPTARTVTGDISRSFTEANEPKHPFLPADEDSDDDTPSSDRAQPLSE